MISLYNSIALENKKQKHETCFFFHLNKVVRKEPPLSIQLSLHPTLLFNVPDVPDNVARSQRQLVIVERVVLILHQDLCLDEEEGRGKERVLSEEIGQGKMWQKLRECRKREKRKIH